MSLIVARKENNNIMLVSDTKLSLPNEKSSSADRQKRTPSAGVIKVTIINSKTCVAFAGGEFFAEEAIRKLDFNISLDDILAELLEAHLASNDVTDFIIASGESEARLFEIKKQQCNEVESAWIGSAGAFSVFQASMQGLIKRQKIGFFIELIDPGTTTDLFKKMSDAMDDVIDDEKIPEVDGFRVNTVFVGDAFHYRGYTHSYRERPINVELPLGVTSMEFAIGHPTAEEGGYNINFFDSPNPQYAGLHILQANLAIVYKRENNGLLRPTIITDIDEVDFIDYAEDNYNMGPSMMTQDRKHKCLTAGDVAANNKDFVTALQWYDKALRKCWGKDRAIFYYRRAVTLANLNRMREVPKALQDAINSDSNYQKLAYELISQIARRHNK